MRMIERKIGGLITSAIPREKSVIYGVKIEKANADPALSVSYTDDSADFSPSYGNNGDFIDNGWENRFPFNKIKPCLLKNGVVQYYLNPNDFTKKLDGRNSDITSGADGDVMIEFPKIWYSISQDDNYVYIKYSNVQQEGFTDWAMSYKGVIQDRFFIGAYLGNVTDNQLRSLSEKTPANLLTIGSLRTYAQHNGDGYEIISWSKIILLQILYLVRFKSLNSQNALGYGYSNANAASATGSANVKGMNFGDMAGSQMKFCGIEDLWGNLLQFVDGLVLNASGLGGISRGSIAVADGNYNDTAVGYSVQGTSGLTMSGYAAAVNAGNKTGFMASKVGGSLGTYYCDYNYLINTSALCFAQYGGNYAGGDQGGIFSLRIFTFSAENSDYTGGRLTFCG